MVLIQINKKYKNNQLGTGVFVTITMMCVSGSIFNYFLSANKYDVYVSYLHENIGVKILKPNIHTYICISQCRNYF